MFVHLFLEDGKHHTFKRKSETAEMPPENGDIETLYLHNGSVGMFTTPQIYVLHPMHKVQAIHFTRKAGEQWTR